MGRRVFQLVAPDNTYTGLTVEEAIQHGENEHDGGSSLVAWSSLWPSFLGPLHCLFVDICLADMQHQPPTYCTLYIYSVVTFGPALSL